MIDLLGVGYWLDVEGLASVVKYVQLPECNSNMLKTDISKTIDGDAPVIDRPSESVLLWSHEQVALVAEAIYEKNVRSIVETPDNLGQFLTLEVESGDYCLSSTMVESILPLKQQHPLGRLFTENSRKALSLQAGDIRRVS